MGLEVVTIIVLGVVACSWMNMSYAKKAAGLKKGASEREIETLQEQVDNIQEEMVALKTEVKRLIQIAKGIDE